MRVARAERGEKEKDHPAKWAKQTLTQTFRVLRHDSGEFARKLITCQNRDYEAVATLTQLEDRKRRQNWAPICASGPSLSSVPERNVFFFNACFHKIPQMLKKNTHLEFEFLNLG